MTSTEPAVHDYRKPQRRWGHDYAYTPAAGSGGTSGNATGWGSGIRAGDWLILQGPTGAADAGSPYRVASVRYYNDPPDMWRAALVYDRAVPAEAAARL